MGDASRTDRAELRAPGPDRPLDAPTATLDAELGGRIDAKAHRCWTNLMKGEPVFHGVPMAGVRASVRAVWAAHDLESWSIEHLSRSGGSVASSQTPGSRCGACSRARRC